MDDEIHERPGLIEKMKANPTVPIGMVGLIGVVAYGITNLKQRKQPLSVYIVQLRVIAQGALVGCMSIGVIYSLITNQFHKLFPKKN